ncbi:MAG: enoyl-CoA hydratase-related protein [Candidatus Hydrogenedentes bacterium]|nr:enoyl-CoA hydratase-related protein [Candidatus Hydrogenedentota bacterium]
MCAVQVYTYTTGVEFLLACDIVIAASDSKFSQLEPKRGIMATSGSAMRLVQRGGWGNAMYHLLTCDEWDAEESYRIGLIQEIAETIAGMAPLAIQATNACSMLYVEEGEAAAIASYSKTQRRLSATEDAAEGVASFKERRDPVLKGR